MSDLVLLHHNEPMTTSLAVAACTENEHDSVILLVRKYINELEEFGAVNFQTAKPGTSRFEIGNSVFEIENCRSNKGRQTEFAFLNEQQSTLLVTFMRNSPVVIELKKALVRAFFALRDSQQKNLSHATSNGLRRLSDPALVLPGHEADKIVASDRTFRAVLRSAKAAGLGDAKAEEVARHLAAQVTGVDLAGAIKEMHAELKLKPAAQGMESFFADWKAGNRPVSYQPDFDFDTLFHDYLSFCRQHRFAQSDEDGFSYHLRFETWDFRKEELEKRKAEKATVFRGFFCYRYNLSSFVFSYTVRMSRDSKRQKDRQLISR